MTQILTTYYAYGVYVIRSKHNDWLECYFIGQQGADVLMESNVLIQIDERLQPLESDIERYGCFETISTQPYRLKLVRTLTEVEKDEWNEWHHLYRELKWKVRSLQSHQIDAMEESKTELLHVQQAAEQLQSSYPISADEQAALSSLLEDISYMIGEFDTTKASSLHSVPDIEVESRTSLNNIDVIPEEAIRFLSEEEPSLTQPIAEIASTIPVPHVLEPIEDYYDVPTNQEESTHSIESIFTETAAIIPITEHISESILDETEEGSNEQMKQGQTVLTKTAAAEENSPHRTNLERSFYENKELTEYFRRFSQLCDAVAPLSHSEDAAIQKLLVQLKIELAWIQTKIVRTLGVYAVHSENKVGEMEFVELRNGVYANKFQILVMHSLFDSFATAAKESSASFDMQKNTIIRMLIELFRDEDTDGKFEA